MVAVREIRFRGNLTPTLSSDEDEPSAAARNDRIEQVGDVFDLPYTVTVQYMDGKTEAVTIPVMDTIVEHKITFRGPVKRIEIRDDLTLADIVK